MGANLDEQSGPHRMTTEEERLRKHLDGELDALGEPQNKKDQDRVDDMNDIRYRLGAGTATKKDLERGPELLDGRRRAEWRKGH